MSSVVDNRETQSLVTKQQMPHTEGPSARREMFGSNPQISNYESGENAEIYFYNLPTRWVSLFVQY